MVGVKTEARCGGGVVRDAREMRLARGWGGERAADEED